MTSFSNIGLGIETTTLFSVDWYYDSTLNNINTFLDDNDRIKDKKRSTLQNTFVYQTTSSLHKTDASSMQNKTGSDIQTDISSYNAETNGLHL